MPFIVQVSGLTINHTVQDVISASAQDIRQVLSGTAVPGQTILIDYCNRIHLDLLRWSRWRFLLANVQRFVTVLGQTDYYVGDITQVPSGTSNTGLNLTDIGFVKKDSVFDRTNFRRLGQTAESPLGIEFSSNALPRLWRNDGTSTPNVINLYPPSQEGTQVSVTSGVRTSNVTTITTATAHLIGSSSRYVTIAGFTDTVFNGTFPVKQVLTSTTFTYNNTGANNLESPASATCLGGFGIDFRYYKRRAQLTNAGQLLQVPDDYFDIMVAGVNWLAFKYLMKPEDTQHWQQVYQAGKVQIVKDGNLFPRGEEFITPDRAATFKNQVFGLGLDSGIPTSIP
jgi:hypothetical protein